MKRTLVIVLIAAVFLIFLLILQKKQGTNDMSQDRELAPSGASNSAHPRVNKPVSEIPLEITEPRDHASFNTSNIVIKGKTVPYASVMLNEEEEEADDQGNFHISTLLDPGENKLTIAAQDDEGRYAEKQVTVTLQTSDLE